MSSAPSVALRDAPLKIDAGPPMVHLATGPDSGIALCGRRLRGIRYPSDTVVDCVVCEDIYEARLRGE